MNYLFDKGLSRVCTNIRIDDRRDKSRKMNDKLTSVQKHLEIVVAKTYEDFKLNFRLS